MDNTTQTDAKTFLRTVTMISALALFLSITLSNAYAVPRESYDGECESYVVGEDTWYKCCWTETEEGDSEQIEIYKCQRCFVEPNGAFNCAPSYPNPNPTGPTTGEDISPGDTGVLEQPPQTNNPPIKSGDSVIPNDDGKVLNQQQPDFQVRNDANVPLNEGLGTAIPRTVEPLPPTCAPGTVLNPDINECLLENPPDSCPDGSIPQSSGPGNTQPECPPSETEEPQAEKQEQLGAEEEEQRSSENGDSSS
jgi:hypothetical protein